MAIGERIHFFRCLRGLTQKHLGTLLGFPERSADIRVAQYEMGDRTPRSDLTKTLSDVLDVSPLALDVPDIDSYLGLMHTLFAMEDLYGMTVENRDGEVVLRID
ncbi:MAG: helix-turn-helix transcriptional regulator, partial [Oscillospiraceae bacterium]|nr:helix-turn-helix transcriptional regulator [Oscillospiraceae bacterium]